MRINDKIRNSTPVFSKDNTLITCTSLLIQEFKQRYPQFARRVDLYRAKQALGQLFSDHDANLQSLADKASLHPMTLIIQYITGCCDNKLQEKILKEVKPTMIKMNQIVLEHKIAMQSLQALDTTKVQVQITKVQVQMTKPNKEPDRRIPKVQELKAAKRCICCMKSGHN